MTSAELLSDAYGRVAELVDRVVAGLNQDDLAFRPDADANSIAWLVWHLTRVQDDHLADVAGTEQVWLAEGWAQRFALPFAAGATGYGHTSEEVVALGQTSGELLSGYHRATFESTRRFLRTVKDADLDRIVDTSWDPPVSLGVRLVSVISDNLQHAGQAAYCRGIRSRIA